MTRTIVRDEYPLFKDESGNYIEGDEYNHLYEMYMERFFQDLQEMLDEKDSYGWIVEGQWGWAERSGTRIIHAETAEEFYFGVLGSSPGEVNVEIKDEGKYISFKANSGGFNIYRKLYAIRDMKTGQLVTGKRAAAHPIDCMGWHKLSEPAFAASHEEADLAITWYLDKRRDYEVVVYDEPSIVVKWMFL